jgi:hypothetical protein
VLTVTRCGIHCPPNLAMEPSHLPSGPIIAAGARLIAIVRRHDPAACLE